ncbi:hypothetical protein C8F04DRAFT_1327448 [Mycena alexandri]|uniref:Peptidase M1 membrane alanine aminopeptidase domain-containing protein n=1 Tax=Mycena alexandri TaxID=1745969 RepID=A0AAD6RZY0_9AGAR|nr:hypothetical protein C8F04DRAFT_1327448 [Mycena alexandri]
MQAPPSMLFSPVSCLLPKDAQWKTTKFQKSPPMSYLVALANGPLAYLEKSIVMPLSGRTVLLRVDATPDILDQGEFRLEVTAKVLPLYEQILDPKKADILSRKMVARVLSHEVAHSIWFGNITTMEWWDYLYLNQGFASKIGEVIMIGELSVYSSHGLMLFPEWEVKSNFVNTHYIEHCLSMPNAPLIPLKLNVPTQTSSTSAPHAFGICQFLKGVSVYLKNHLYGNNVTRDLWDGISAETRQDIPCLMNDWVSKIGFPLITVTDGTPETEENKTIWNVTLRILAVLGERRPSPHFQNAGTVGFYRVLYTAERLSKIATAAAKANSVFSLSDRIGLMYDVAALSDLNTGNDTEIPSNLRVAIFVAAVKYGGREEFDALIKIIENPVNPASKSAAITAIGKIEDLDLVEELFSYILTGVPIKT